MLRHKKEIVGLDKRGMREIRFDEIFQPHFLNQRRIRGGAMRFEFFTLGAFW